MRGHQVEVVHCKDAYYVRGGQQPSTTTYRDHPNVTVHTLENPLGFFLLF